MGYNIETHGQKGFNGVAILSRLPLADVRRGLPGDDGDEQARWIEAEVAGVRICGLYLPNGNPAPGPKYDYKLAWMDRLQARAEALIASGGNRHNPRGLQRNSRAEGRLEPERLAHRRALSARDPRRLPPPRPSRLHRRAARRRPGAGHLHVLGLPGRRVPEELGAQDRPRAPDPAGGRPARDLRRRRRDPLAGEAVRPRADLGDPRALSPTGLSARAPPLPAARRARRRGCRASPPRSCAAPRRG